MVELRHGRVSLWMETSRVGGGPALLLLHELGGDGASAVAAHGSALEAWPGAIHTLDLSGHGRSGRLRGGGYTVELLASDADAAIEALDAPVWLSGTGLGAYVALLLAGARPDVVIGAMLWPGAGLAGGGAEPDFSRLEPPAPIEESGRGSGLQVEPATDPHALRQLEGDLRPADYAETFAAAARHLLLVETATPRPPWWEIARAAPGARALEEPDPRRVFALASELATAPDTSRARTGSG